MTILLTAVHVTVCLFLIFIVLVQGGRGAELGATFGGSSQTLFGGRGATTFLSKLTTAAAALFMVTSLLLTIIALKGGSTIIGQPRQGGAPMQRQTLPVPGPAAPGQPAQKPAPAPGVPLTNPPQKTPAGR